MGRAFIGHALVIGAALSGGGSVSCSLHGACTPGGDGSYVEKPYATLAEYCMVNIENGDIAPEKGVVPYDEGTPLFSDYAIKRRTVWVPPGTSASYEDDGPYDFPVGTIVTKSFGFADDMRNPSPVKWLETRVLVRTASGWTGDAYVWDDAQQQATIKPGGTFRDLSFIEPDGTPITTSYLVPNRNECIKCHENMGAIVPIGLQTDRLNHDHDYPEGRENQLAHWSKLGILSGAPDPATAPSMADWTDTSLTTETRARAYLEANCAHCHSATGEARNTGLLLDRDVTEPYRFGVCKTPVATGKAASDLSYDVVPGQPDQSIMIYRMESTTPSIMMPEIGRSLVHTEGARVVRDWISGLPGSCP